MKETVQVVAIPTSKKSPLWKTKMGNYGRANQKAKPINPVLGTNLHIYFIIDRQLKVGDNYIGEGFTARNPFIWSESQAETYPNHVGAVIVASTDMSIGRMERSLCPYCRNIPSYKKGGNGGGCGVCHDIGGEMKLKPIPKIQDNFIKAFVIADGNISEVQIEMETSYPQTGQLGYEKDGGTILRDCIITPKTRTDNSVIIHRARTYTKEEVINIAKKVMVHTNMEDDMTFGKLDILLDETLLKSTW